MAYVGLFETSGKMAKPWADAGFPCYCLDIQNDGQTRDGVTYLYADLSDPRDALLALADVKPVFVAGFPPCDHLAVSGARWFKGKGLRALASSINLFATAAELCEGWGAPYLIENPVSTISTYWRKPDYTFHPGDYAALCPTDTYTKKTCLWVGNGFRMPDRRPLDGAVLDDRIHKAAPGADRKNFRSATPLGFARAVYQEHAA